MLRTFLLGTVLTLGTAVIAPSPLAQDATTKDAHNHDAHNHDDHAGHNHADGQHGEPADIDIDHVLTQAPDDHVIGAADAKDTLIVYASVTCGHCGGWFTDDYPELKKSLIDTGKMKLVFREFPTQPAQVAYAGFQIANCAAPERYFDMITTQMQNQETTFQALKDGKAIERFIELAEPAGITDKDALFACFDKTDGMEKIERSMKRAQAAGVRGVPALFLNGEPIKGKADAAAVKALVLTN